MYFGSMNTPVVKGAAKIALGVSIWGMVMALDSVNMLPNDSYGKATKYAGLAAGALYAMSGVSKIMVGE